MARTASCWHVRRAIKRLSVNCSLKTKWTGMWWTKWGILTRFTVSLSTACVIVGVPHLQYGRGAVHLACRGGHVQLVKTLVEEFEMSLDIRDDVSSLQCTRLHLWGVILSCVWLCADIKGKLAQVDSMRCNVTQLVHELVLSCFNNFSQVKYVRRCLDQGLWSLSNALIFEKVPL